MMVGSKRQLRCPIPTILVALLFNFFHRIKTTFSETSLYSFISSLLPFSHAMNWTGGHLSRHSRGGATASLNQLQKSHFAKVRSNLRNGMKKQSPIKWSIFGKIQVQEAGHDASQPIIDDTPRYTRNSHYISCDRYQPQLRESQYTRQPTPGPATQDRIRGEDFYSATPPALEKRKHELTAPGNGCYKDAEFDFISKKRQKLLEKEDWVGITYQRPLQIKFASPNHTDNVGRRKFTDGHQARYAHRQPTLISPFMTRARLPSLQKYDSQDLLGRADVRIHIGDRVVPPGISSTSAPTEKSRRHSVPQKTRERSQVASSDVMLLGNEGGPVNSSSSITNETPMDDQETQVFDTELYLVSRRHSPRGQFDAQRNHDDYESGCGEQCGSGKDGQHFRDEDNSAQDYHYRSTEADTSSHIPEHSVPLILGTPFSPSLIKHPIPQSSRVSSILHSGPSEIANSTIAQVGKVQAIVPSSQILDNEIWETWMVPMYNEWPGHDQFDREDSIEQGRSISPGVSTAPIRQISHLTSKRYLKYTTDTEAEEFDEVDKASKVVNPSISDSSSTEAHIERQKPLQKVLRRKPEGHYKMVQTKESARGVESPNKSLGMSNIYAGEKKQENSDDIWRKFVFGSDEVDEINVMSKPSLTPNAIALSMQGNTSTLISVTSPTNSENQSQNIPGGFSSEPHTSGTISKRGTSPSDIPCDPPRRRASTAHLSKVNEASSLHTSKSTPKSCHSDLALVSDGSTSSFPSDRGADSMAVIVSSQSRSSKSSEALPSPKLEKVLFTRLKRYDGVKATSESSRAEQGRFTKHGLVRGEYAWEKRTKKKEHDIYSLVDLDEILPG
jgi:hypothetical protein